MIFLTKDGKLDDTVEQPYQLADLSAAMAKPGTRLLLHLHGGLVNHRNGMATADRLSGPQGWSLPGDWVQVYPVWGTGALQTAKTNWKELATNDRLYKAVVAKLIEFVSGKLGGAISGRGGASVLDHDEIMRGLNGQGDRREPFAALEERTAAPAHDRRSLFGEDQPDAAMALDFQDWLAGDHDFNAAVADIDAAVNSQAEGRGLIPPQIEARGARSLAALSTSVRAPMAQAVTEAERSAGAAPRGPIAVAAFLLKHAGKIAFNVFKRFRAGTHHGVHATIVEEVLRELYGDLIGDLIWGFMVQDAADHFAAGGFGNLLIDALPADKPVHIVVSGHSAGSIWAAQFLKAVAASGRPITLDLVLLAPAVRNDLFAEALRAGRSHIKRCRMFTMGDDLEKADAVLGHDLGFIYPSSLLYLVSGLFEHQGADAFVDAPLLGMQRFVHAPWHDARQVAAAQEIAAFFQQPGHDIVYSPTAELTLADSHGGFDTERTTLQSVSRFCKGQTP